MLYLKDDIIFKEIFSLVTEKDSLRIILNSVSQYDLELLRMDARGNNISKWGSRWGIIHRSTWRFCNEEKETITCKLKRSI